MNLYEQYSKRPGHDNNNTKKENNDVTPVREKGYILEILGIVKNIFNRQDYIKKDTENILRSLNNFNSLNIPCQIVSMTPKQLYMAYKGGWSTKQLSGLSGMDEMLIQTKIESYMKNNT